MLPLKLYGFSDTRFNPVSLSSEDYFFIAGMKTDLYRLSIAI